jgi:hypothetical protein
MIRGMSMEFWVRRILVSWICVSTLATIRTSVHYYYVFSAGYPHHRVCLLALRQEHRKTLDDQKFDHIIPKIARSKQGILSRDIYHTTHSSFRISTAQIRPCVYRAPIYYVQDPSSRVPKIFTSATCISKPLSDTQPIDTGPRTPCGTS